MRRAFRPTSTAKRWVRGFDWDGARFATLQNTGVQAWDIARWPADDVDPATGLLISPKTIVKTLLSLQMETSAVANATDWQFFFGVMAIDAYQGVIAPTALPDVTNAALDWMAWISAGALNISGAATNYITQFNAQAGDQGMLEFSSQRKLPPGRAIIWTATMLGPVGSSWSIVGALRMGLKGAVTAAGLGGN